MNITKNGKALGYEEFTIRIPVALTKQVSKQKTLTGAILYLQPVYKDKKIDKMVLVGHNYCSPSACDVMVESCSACKVNATKGAKAMVEKDEVSKRAEKAGIILPEGSILAP